MGKQLSIRDQKEKEIAQEKFGKRMAEIRTEKNITQENFAFDLGVDRTYISYIERGKRNPSLYMIYKIVKALKVSASELLSF